MTRDRLQSLSYAALKEFLIREGIKNYENLPIGKFIETVIEAIDEKRNERIISNNVVIRGEEKKYDILRDEEIEPYENISIEIPKTYLTTKVQLILVEPFIAFAYWDFSEKERLAFINTTKHVKLFLRVFEKPVIKDSTAIDLKNTTAKNDTNDGEPDFFDIPVKVKDESWYINLPENNRSYFCELVLSVNNEQKILCKSNTITSPEKTFKDIKEAGNFIDEDILFLSGIYNFGEEDNDNPIPQRIISFLNNKYLN
jgi:hypothetical protein